MEFSGEVRTFLSIMLAGGFLGCMFDVYRVTRGTLKLRKLTTSAADILYWLLATAITFAVLVAVNGGQIRLYILIALGLGAALYFGFVSRYVIRTLVRSIKISIKTKVAIEKTCRMVFLTIIAKPIYFIYKIIIRPFKTAYRGLKNFYNRLLPPPDPPPE